MLAKRIGDFGEFLGKRILERMDECSRNEKLRDVWNAVDQKYYVNPD